MEIVLCLCDNGTCMVIRSILSTNSVCALRQGSLEESDVLTTCIGNRELPTVIVKPGETVTMVQLPRSVLITVIIAAFKCC